MDSRISKSSGSRRSRTRSGGNLPVGASETRGSRSRRTARARPPPNSTRAQRLQEAILAAVEEPRELYRGSLHSDVANLPQERPPAQSFNPQNLLDPSSFGPTPSVSSPGATLSAFPLDPVTGPYSIDLSTDRGDPLHHQTELQDMSTLGFILPSQQYIPLEHYAHTFHPPSFVMEPHCAAPSPALSQTSSPPTTYAPSFSPGSTLLHPSPGLSQRRSSGVHEQTPGQPFQPLRSPYETQQTSPHAGYASGGYSAAPSASPALSSTSSHPPSFVAPAPGNLGQEAGGTAYGSNYPGSSTQYAGSGYNVGYTPLPGPSQLYMPPPRSTYPPPYRQGSIAAETATAPAGGEAPVKVINSRPKPQCWDHGCNGRQFSTFSNLLRHQREKSGTAAKSYCPRCGAEFTRTTAMKGHMAHDKCKRANTSEAG